MGWQPPLLGLAGGMVQHIPCVRLGAALAADGGSAPVAAEGSPRLSERSRGMEPSQVARSAPGLSQLNSRSSRDSAGSGITSTPSVLDSAA